jgi:hypothetical protein
MQRRSRAWRLVDVDGVSVQEAASRMELPPGQVRRLVALHRDALERKAFKQDSIPVARLRISQSDLDRRLGLGTTKHSANPDKRRVGIQHAGETVRALGRAPHELEGC